ncbi:MAG TPA: MYXO-CTERM sorting domain-containing protein, partial [Polyangia bacterium]|nr:MYXO-CTERM sorting domain-containing protein [Polyangia bacterium]
AFRFENGATRVGFSLDDLEKANTLYVNGAPMGVLGTAPGTTDLALGADRNGYVVVVAEAGERIDSVAIDNGATGDGWVVDHLVYEEIPATDGGVPDASSTPPTSQSLATLFVTDDLANRIYRYAIAPGAAPALAATVTAPSANDVAVRSTGELFALDYAGARVSRFLYPFGPSYAAGKIADVGLARPERLAFVGGELWILNSDAAADLAPQSIVRLGFDVAGNAAPAGTIADPALVGANRGLLWNAATSDLYVSQCCAVSQVLHFHPDLDGALTQLSPLTGGGLADPHGMVITAGRELLVANNATPSISRFALDVEGQGRPVGVFLGNGLASPVGLALAPWGEVFAVNQGSGTISRFTIGPAGDLAAAGTFPVSAPSATSRLGWAEIVVTGAACAPRTAPACNPPAPDASVDALTDAGASTDAAADAAPSTDGPATRDAAAGGSGAVKSGCGCATTGGGGLRGGAAGFGVLALLAAARRRRIRFVRARR